MTSDETTLEPKKSIFLMDSALYDVLKYFDMIILPLFSTLYIILGLVWDFPNVKQVVGISVGIQLLLGFFLMRSSDKFMKNEFKYDGDIVITQGTDGKKIYTLQLNGHPSELDDKKEVFFKINPIL